MDEFRQPKDFSLKSSEDAGSSPSAVADGPGTRILEPGQMVADRYKVISFIGKGAMGHVYRVEQVYLQKQFALKTLSPIAASSVAVRRFQTEAQAASRLEHPNLVKATDFGMLEGDQPFYVMELLEGTTVSKYLKAVGALNMVTALNIFIPVCRALDYAHQQGVVHRDLKPGNIILVSSATEKLVPKIVDFGIAKLEPRSGEDGQGLTKTGEVFGTPIYMSPEQCQGTRVDSRSDIYSLGCVLFEVLTGAPPFRGDTALVTMMQHQSGAIPSLREASLGRDIPSDLETVVSKMLAKDANDRYQTCGEAAEDLAVILQGKALHPKASAVATKPGATFAQPQGSGQPRRIRFAMAITIAVIAISLFGLLCRMIWQTDAEKKPAVVNQLELPVTKPVTQPTTQTVTQPTAQTATQPISQSTSQKEPTDPLIARYMEDPEAILRDSIVGRRALEFAVPSGVQVTDKALAPLRQRDNIISLGLSGQKALTDDCVKYFKHLPLRRLNLTNTCLTDRALKEIATIPTLETLELRAVNAGGTRGITSNGVQSLANLHFLHQIDLSSDMFDDRDLATVCRISTLTGLEFRSDRVTDEGLKQLSKLRQLTKLGLADNRDIHNSGLASLKGLKELSDLDLSITHVSDQGLPVIASLHLMRLDLDWTDVTDAGVQELGKMRDLRELSIDCPQVTKHGVDALSMKLKDCKIYWHDRPEIKKHRLHPNTKTDAPPSRQ